MGMSSSFLPGAAEIRRAMEACAKLAQDNDLSLVALHGDLPPASKIAPSARRRGERSFSRRTSPNRASRSKELSPSSTAGSCASSVTRRGPGFLR